MNPINIFKSSLFAAAAFASVSGFSATHAHDEAKTHYIEIKSNDKHLRTMVQDMGMAIDEIRSDKFYVAGTMADLKKLQTIGAPATAQEIPERWFNMDIGLNANRFTSYADVKTQLVALANQYPHLVSQTTLGNSIENRDMTMLRISGRNLGQAETEQLPVVLFTGCHHAREHLSVEVPLRMAKYLAENYATNPKIKELLDTREIYIAPVVNPDGHVHDYSNGLRGSMWRKNRRRNSNGSYGVDLNRNYGYQWGTGGSSSNPGSDTYKGVEPFSEAESQNVKFFVDSQPRMTMLISFHTFSELILYPWGHSYEKIGETRGNAADLPIFEKMARDMATWNGYAPQQSSDLYIASGDTTDWAYGEHGIFAFTFELSPKSMWNGGFYPSPSVIEPTFEANINPMLYMIEYADDPSRVMREDRPSFDITPAGAGVGMASFSDIKIK